MKLVKTAAFGRICKECFQKNISTPTETDEFEKLYKEQGNPHGKCNICQRS